MSVQLPTFYAIVDPVDTGRDPVALAADLLAGGARMLQVRLKPPWTPRQVYAVGKAIRGLPGGRQALLLINDRPDLAAAVAADGVHLGQDDVPVSVARTVLGAQAIVGVSTHNAAEAQAAVAAGASYVAVGPGSPTTTKADARSVGGLALVRAVRAVVTCPLVAIGGITPLRLAEIRAAGADAIAMIGAINRAADVAAATRSVLAILC